MPAGSAGVIKPSVHVYREGEQKQVGNVSSLIEVRGEGVAFHSCSKRNGRLIQDGTKARMIRFSPGP